MTLAPPRPNAFLPDERQPALPDILARSLYFAGTSETSHSTLTVGNEQSTEAAETMRIRSVTVGELDTDTVTIQVYIDGVPVFDDDHRPVSGGATQEPTTVWNFPPGSVITTTIEAVTGVPAGTANVVIDTESFLLVSPTEQEELKGRDRLKVSQRRRRKLTEFKPRILEASLIRFNAGIGAGTGGFTGQQGGGTRVPDIIATPPRPPGSGTSPPRGGGRTR